MDVVEIIDDPVGAFVLNLDAIIRLGGSRDADGDDAESIRAALQLAREKYGIHFEGDEATVLRDGSGGYFCSSMPVNIEGTFEVCEKTSTNHFISRYAEDLHFCLVPGCTEPQIRTHENKYSNGQTHIRRHHPELTPFSLWNKDMLSKREGVWKELNSLAKRKIASGNGGASSQKKQRTLDFTPCPSPAPQRKSSLHDTTLVLVKFVCLGLFAMRVTMNPGFVYLVEQLTNNLKLSSPNTIQRRLLKEFEELVGKRKISF